MSKGLPVFIICLAVSLTAQASYTSNSKQLPQHIKLSDPRTHDHLVIKHGPKKVHTPAQPKQMWNLQNADIQAVVQTISQLTGKNFVVDPRVQGKVTLISAKPMTVHEMYNVFLSMLQVLNYSVIPSGNVIKIVPSMDAKGYGGTLVTGKHPGRGDQVVVRVVPVNNVSAVQLVSILRPLMLDWGSISAYQPSNSLVLAGTASNINQLVDIIHNLDRNNGSSVKAVHLKYADATKLAQVIQQLQSANSNQGKVNNVAVVADQSANMLLVSGNTDNRDKTIKLIKQLDTPNSAGASNTAVIRLNYLTAKKVAPMLTKLAHGFVAQERKTNSGRSSTFGVGASSSEGVSIQAVNDDNAIVLSGPFQVIQSLKGVIKKIDIRPQQVLVQAVIVKMDVNSLSQFGIQWGTTNPTGASSGGDNSSVGSMISQALQNGVGYIKEGSFRAIVTALSSNGNSDILATPSVLVLNNQKASISDGKNIGILSRQNMTNVSNGNDGTVPFNNYDRKDVTLSLDVTPQIAPDNTVRLVIKQKNDSLGADAKSSDPNPTINTSKINTTVLVDSGDVLVLGGLISNNSTSKDEKIPVLGDIPVLGKLFHYTTKTTDKKNLMVFIRPVIINSKKEANAQSMKKYNYIRYQEMRRKAGLGMSNSDRFPVLPYKDRYHSATLPPPF